MKYIGFKHQRENKQNSDKAEYHNITDILLKVALNTITLTRFRFSDNTKTMKVL
jgi:hypothetical protein